MLYKTTFILVRFIRVFTLYLQPFSLTGVLFQASPGHMCSLSYVVPPSDICHWTFFPKKASSHPSKHRSDSSFVKFSQSFGYKALDFFFMIGNIEYQQNEFYVDYISIFSKNVILTVIRLSPVTLERQHNGKSTDWGDLGTYHISTTKITVMVSQSHNFSGL